MTARAALLLTAARAALFFVLWLLLVDDLALPELIAGGMVALLAAMAVLSLPSQAEHGGLRPAMLRFAYRPLLLLVADTGRVFWALLRSLALRRPVSGRFRTQRYAATGDGAQASMRRALTEWGASLGASRYVVGIDCDEGVLLVRELVQANGPLDPLELG